MREFIDRVDREDWLFDLLEGKEPGPLAEMQCWRDATMLRALIACAPLSPIRS